MSFASPANLIPRRSIAGMEGMYVKMWDPPTESPATPELLTPTNPVPEVRAAAGFANAPAVPHTLDIRLMHGMQINAWDGKPIEFFLFQDNDVPVTGGGVFPAATIRVPRGAIFHADTQGAGPPPHTIHWHGIEPTPMNDGVGHCSMELGQYTYQWQPNFIGSYFFHCHRNTMQHFEFGLYGFLIIDPPDAFFATQADPTIPIGAGTDGLRRTAANLTSFRRTFPGWVGGLLTSGDPHAMTVPYDVEALWVVDDRDSVWSDLASNARATYPRHGDQPGVNDSFTENPGVNGFFAFNDFNADYWYVTGASVPVRKGGVGAISPSLTIPPELMSGVSGVQVSINARVGQTILLRCLDAAYNAVRVTLPVPCTVIAFDGRALGVPPFGYGQPFTVRAGTPIKLSTARRFDCLIKPTRPMNTFATVEFFETRGGGFDVGEKLSTAQIPFVVTP